MSLRSLFKYERIYCFPNRLGWVGFFLFLVTILAAATYQNNLVFIMGFLLLCVSMIAIMQTARTIRAIDILALKVNSNFAGEMASAEITIMNPSDEIKLNMEVDCYWEYGHIHFVIAEILPNSTAQAVTHFLLGERRGIYPIKKIKISSTYPYGLFRAWKYKKNLKAEVAIYPRPKGQNLALYGQGKSNEDFSRHKIYEPGDSFSRIDWKIFSRKNQFFIREFSESAKESVQLRYQDAKQIDNEEKLSQLSLWILQAEQLNMEYGLEAPHAKLNLGRNELHYHKCMKSLASAK